MPIKTPKIQFHVVRENLANVIVNGKESHWYVEKSSNGWYKILWGCTINLLQFRQQSWFDSESKEEIKEKLQDCVRYPVDIYDCDRRGKYVYQRSYKTGV